MSQQTTDYVIHGIVRSPIGAAEPQSQSRMAGSAAAELAPGSLCPASACPSPAANTEPQANVCSDSPAFNNYVMSCIMYKLKIFSEIDRKKVQIYVQRWK